MKIIAFSDLHIHDYQQHSINHSRLNDCLSVLDVIFKAAFDNDITYILFCGDLFDKAISVPTFVLNKTLEKFDELFNSYPKIKFISISGNHDYAIKKLYKKEVCSSQFALNIAFDNFILIDNEVYYLLDINIKIYPLLFHEFDEDYYKSLDDITVSEDDYNILLTHVTIQGCINNVGSIDATYKGFDKFDCILAGDIHKKTMITDKFLMCGNPLHRNLSDAGDDKGFFFVDIEKGKNPLFEFVCLNDRFPCFVKKESDDINTIDLSCNKLLYF